MLSILETLTLNPVSTEEVALYYLRAELGGVVEGEPQLRHLDSKSLWRLLEALSYTYRANSMFTSLSRQDLSWYRVTLPVEHISLSGMSPQLTKLIYHESIAQDPLKLRDHLLRYFAAHPHDDPEGLDECRPRPVKTGLETIIVHQKQDQLRMLDGSHRFIARLLDGAETVEAYLGLVNDKPPQCMRGDTIFLTMRRLFAKAKTEADRQAILRVTQLLRQGSSDGDSAIQQYWIDYPNTPEAAAAGKLLLAEPHESGTTPPTTAARE